MLKLFIAFVFSLPLMAQEKFTTYDQKITDSEASFRMVAVKGGEFMLGSENSEKVRENDEVPVKQIVISDFWIGETELTYDIFQLFLDETKDPGPKADGISRPSKPYIDFTLGMGKQGEYPANSMQQYSALMFCKWLYKRTGIFYRLPTEAEWEYVAKLSYTHEMIQDDKILQEYEWFATNSENKYHKVATKKANTIGIYDILGNVSEWTMDQYDPVYYEKITEGSADPVSLKTKRYPTTVRGGNYRSEINDLRPANRTMSDPLWNRRDPQMPKSKWWNADAPFIGFRLVRPFKKKTKTEVDAFFESVLK